MSFQRRPRNKDGRGLDAARGSNRHSGPRTALAWGEAESAGRSVSMWSSHRWTGRLNATQPEVLAVSILYIRGLTGLRKEPLGSGCGG
jgi:hypothetical protein